MPEKISEYLEGKANLLYSLMIAPVTDDPTLEISIDPNLLEDESLHELAILVQLIFQKLDQL